MANKKILFFIFVSVFFLIFLLTNVSGLFAGGDGTFDDPYKISTCYDLQNISLINIPQYFELINDIDCSATKNWDSGKGFFPLGNIENIIPIFEGNFNGNGFSIEGLYINRNTLAPLGLFSISDGEIKNVQLIDVNISGKDAQDGGVAEGYRIGGLVGLNRGNIYNISVKGEIKGEYALGGLVGQNGQDNDFTAKIFESKSDIKITVLSSALTGVGGFVGMNYGEIYNSYAEGKIYASNANTYIIPGAGGFAGGNTKTILNSYSTVDLNLLPDSNSLGGFVGYSPSACANSFWNNQTSGITTSACGTGKTTTQMKQQNTFTPWDFTNIWHIHEGINYPCLRWLRWACLTPEAYWTSDTQGQTKITSKITVPIQYSKVYLVLEEVPSTPQNLFFEVWEKDSSGEDDAVKNGADKLTGTILGNKIIAEWTITQADISKAKINEDADNNFEFYFKVYEGTPSNLIIQSSDLLLEWQTGPLCSDDEKQSCGTDVGECQAGTQTCAGGTWGTCVGEITPTTEICGDGIDQDCNGADLICEIDCSQYNLCSQITNSDDCNSCPVSSLDGCEWDSLTTPSCNPYEDQDNNGQDIHCVYTENTDDDCTDGSLTYSLTTSTPGCAPKDPVSIFCSAQTSLPLENKFGILLTIISIMGIYFIFLGERKF